MKSVFDAQIREELRTRIASLTTAHSPLWGKMNVSQMVKHCTLCDDMINGTIKIKRVFIGRFIGPFFLRKALRDETPFDQNSPSSPILITTDFTGDLEEQKHEWLKRIDQYANFSNTGFIHPFFGRMTKDQIGRFVYKHADHHLRQFGG